MAKRRPRGTLVYNKPPLSVVDLVGQLATRGLGIPDQDRAERYLRHIGYYRLSPYTIPFQTPGPGHAFRPGVEFDDILDLYVFDRSLRLLVLDALERVEVAVRAALTDHMANTYSDAHWYVDPTHFKNQNSHKNFLSKIEEASNKQLQGSAERVDPAVPRSALEHYLTTYATPALPPSWLMGETITIGQLCTVYRNLANKADRTAIAASVGLTAPVLESWLLTYVRVRNICAHHGRLWNVGLGVYPAIPKSSSISWVSAPISAPSTQRLYPVLVSLQSVLDTISPYSTWADRLNTLLQPRPQMNLDGAGIPVNWADDPFWSKHISSVQAP